MTIATFACVSAIATLPFEHRNDGTAIQLVKHEFSFLKADNSVDFDALDAHVKHVIAKIAHGLDNYEKNTGLKHPDAKNGSITRKRGASIPLSTNRKKQFWWGTITIGTPPRPFSVVLDTGSADLILPAAGCGVSCNGHRRLDPAKSKYPLPTESDCTVNYIDGSMVKGDKYTSNLTIAGFMADTQTMCAATKYSPRFHIDKFPADGVMGMAFSPISTYTATPVFGTLVNERKVTKQMFSFNLTAGGGELYVGGANRDLYKDDFVYTPVTKEGYWQVEVENIRGKEGPILNKINAIIDTATTAVIGDLSRVGQLHDALGGKHYVEGYYTYPCDSFPDVRLTFNGKSFPISASTHNIGRVEIDHPDCVSGIVGGHSEAYDFWSVGGVFLQNVYTIFDYGNRQVGFAEHA